MARSNPIIQRIALDGGRQIKEELRALGVDGRNAFQQIGAAIGDLNRVSSAASKHFVDLNRGVVAFRDRVSKLTAPLSGLTRQVGALGATIIAAFSVRALIDMTSAWTDLNSRIANVIPTAENAAEVMDKLRVVARNTFSSLAATVDTFVRNSQVLKELGLSTKEQLEFQAAFNDALVVSNARGQRAEQVTNALTKAMSTGALRGEELNTVMTYGGRIARLLGEHFNVTQGELRGLSEQGLITSDVIRRVLVGSMATLRAEAEAMPGTIVDGFLQIQNALLAYIGTADSAAGVSRAIADALLWVADNIDIVVNGLLSFVALWGIVKGFQLAKELAALGGILLTQILRPLLLIALANPFTAMLIVIGLVAAAIALMNVDWSKMGEVVTTVWQVITSVFTSVSEAIANTMKFFEDLWKIADEVLGGIVGYLKQIVTLGGGQVVEQGGEAAPGLKGGGQVRGPGTSTSDSILARLSTGEFVVKASAVRKYGSEFLRSLNAMRLPKFNMGGMVQSVQQSILPPMLVPSFADGGAVSSPGRPLSLTLMGETFDGLMAPEDVAERLTRFATGKQLRRSAKMPSWYRG